MTTPSVYININIRARPLVLAGKLSENLMWLLPETMEPSFLEEAPFGKWTLSGCHVENAGE